MELVGFILPPVIEVINKDVKSDDERFLVAMVICFLLAIGIDWQSVTVVNWHSVFSIAGTFSILFTESQTVFKLYWGNSVLRDKVQAVIGVQNRG